ncbi:hypothetical protein ACVEOO_24680, partial [Escherichia coli]
KQLQVMRNISNFKHKMRIVKYKKEALRDLSLEFHSRNHLIASENSDASRHNFQVPLNLRHRKR